MLSLAVLVMSTAFVGLGRTAGAQGAQGEVGCGTDLLELTQNVGNIGLVGNDGPAAATSTVSLSQPLAAGTYAVRTVSMDRHWSERRDQPREQFTVTVGAATVGPTTDLPKDADFLGAMTATSADENLANVPVDVFPGELIGTIDLDATAEQFTLTHVDGGAGNGSNSISAHQVTFTCVATDLGISFANTSRGLSADGSAILTLTVSNDGAVDQTGVRVRSVLPKGVDLDGVVDAASGTTSSIGATIRWEGDLPADASVDISIPIVTSADGYAECADESAQCSVFAEIVGADSGAPSTDPATVDLTATADLEVGTSYAPANGDSGQFAGTITVSVTNAADSFLNLTADGIAIESDFGSSLSIDENSLGLTAGDIVRDDSMLRWNVGSLAPGESAAYSVNVLLPGVGTFSVRSQVVSSSVADPDSTPNSLAARTGDDDITTLEDDEAAAVAVAVASTTSTTTFTTTSLPTTTTRAPLVVEAADITVDDAAEPAFELDLTEEEVIDLTGLDNAELDDAEATDADDRTEVAGAIELPTESIPIIDDQRDRTPIAALIAVLLVALSVAVVLADRQNGERFKAAATADTDSPTDTPSK